MTLCIFIAKLAASCILLGGLGLLFSGIGSPLERASQAAIFMGVVGSVVAGLIYTWVL